MCSVQDFIAPWSIYGNVFCLGPALSSPVPLPYLYFDSFFYPVAPIVSSTGRVVQYTQSESSRVTLLSTRLPEASVTLVTGS